MIDRVISRKGIAIRLTDETWSHIIEEHAELAGMRRDVLEAVSDLERVFQGNQWSSYDAETDVLYINFKKPSRATDSELTDEDVIIRYEGEEVIGLTILHASRRLLS
jgi:uncharacterized protein YuzE